MASRRILIVEDEVIAALNTRMSLADLGHEVIDIVVSGEEAIKTARDTRPDLVLMDIVLAGEMDGIEAAKQIMKEVGIPVVFVTAHTDKSTAGRMSEMKPAGILEKPVDDQQWKETLKKVFGTDKGEKD